MAGSGGLSDSELGSKAASLSRTSNLEKRQCDTLSYPDLYRDIPGKPDM